MDGKAAFRLLHFHVLYFFSLSFLSCPIALGMDVFVVACLSSNDEGRHNEHLDKSYTYCIIHLHLFIFNFDIASLIHPPSSLFLVVLVLKLSRTISGSLNAPRKARWLGISILSSAC